MIDIVDNFINCQLKTVIMNVDIFIILLSFFLWPYFVHTITVSVKQELTQYLF